MSNALKSMYISYPFMQIADRPDWFTQVKDARIVAKFSAASLDMAANDDNIIATFTGIVQNRAYIHVECKPIGLKAIQVPIYREKDACPATQSFFIVDDDMDLSAVGIGLNYRLHPDCVLVMQEAPMITGNTTAVASFYDGSNITAMHTQDGALFYGAVGGGTGLYYQELEESEEYLKGVGLKAINGISGDVWIRGTYPVEVTMGADIIGGTYTMTAKHLKV